VNLRGAVHIDPRTDDFFKVMVEQREKLKNAPELSTLDLLFSIHDLQAFRRQQPSQAHQCVDGWIH
jgi:hypothetical protein